MEEAGTEQKGTGPTGSGDLAGATVKAGGGGYLFFPTSPG